MHIYILFLLSKPSSFHAFQSSGKIRTRVWSKYSEVVARSGAAKPREAAQEPVPDPYAIISAGRQELKMVYLSSGNLMHHEQTQRSNLNVI